MPAPSLSYRRFISNVIALAGGRVIAILLAMVLATVFVRTLGAELYGTWSFFFVLIGYHALFDLGLSVAVERAVASAHLDRGKLERLLNSAMTLALAISALLQVLVAMIPEAWYGAVGRPDVVRRCLLVLPACLACSNLSAVASAGLSGLQRMAAVTALRSVIGGATTGLVIGLALAGVERVEWLLVAYAAGLLATGVAAWILVRRETEGLRWRPLYLDRASARELASVGGPVQLTTLGSQLTDQALRVLLGARFGAASIGAYDLASRAAVALRSVAASVFVAMVPFAAGRQAAGGAGELSRLLTLSSKHTAVFLIAGTIPAFLAADELMRAWLGPLPELALVRRMFAVVLISLFVQSVCSPMISIARSAGRAVPETVASLAAQAAALAIAAGQSSPVAMVATLSVAMAASAVVLWLWLLRALRLAAPPPAMFVRLAIVAAGTGVVVWGARVLTDFIGASPLALVLIVGAAGACTASLLALGFGIVTEDERQALRALLNRVRPRHA